MSEVKNGILQSLASGLTLRDWFAAQAIGAAATCRRPDERVVDVAYEIADDMLAARDASAAEAERQRRLAAIGALAIDDWNDALDGGQALDEACAAYVREAKAAPTDPAPAPEDVGLAVAVPDAEAERLVGAKRGGGKEGST